MVAGEPEPPAIEAFRLALADSGSTRVISLNDWAPLSAHRFVEDDTGGIGYTLLRWPVLIFLSIWIWLLLQFYFFIRLYVSLSERLFIWTGRRRLVREGLRSAESYDEWLAAALKLDSYLGLQSWKAEPKSSYYDWLQVDKILGQMRTVGDDDEQLAIYMETCLKYNFAGVHNAFLYSQTYSGTKDRVVAFHETLIEGLKRLETSKTLTASTKKLLFSSFEKNIGHSALCLSGGASFAYRHFGVVKALLDQDLLPTIVSGTSGGGLVAALVCTRTNAELRQVLNPSLAQHLTACWEPFPQWVLRWWRTGARFDAVDWATRSRWITLGDLTFREAYIRTGKTLNISAVPADPNSPSILCNHVTSPDCVIWSAILASAAVPGILNPVTLIMKTRDGRYMPYSFGSKWKDGSLRTDIPVRALNTYFNVNFSIVSQVNPHIKLFAYLPRGQVGRPVSHKYSHSRWRGGFLCSAFETSVKLEIKKCLKLLRNLQLIPRFMNQDWSNVFLQQFQGSVTVWPKIRLRDFWYILSDPTEKQLAEMMTAGERTIYPKITMIKLFVSLERAVAQGCKTTNSTQ